MTPSKNSHAGSCNHRRLEGTGIGHRPLCHPGRALEVPDPLQIRTRLKNSVRALGKDLKDAGVDESTAAVLKEPLQTLASSIETQRLWRSDLVVYRSLEIFAISWCWNWRSSWWKWAVISRSGHCFP